MENIFNKFKKLVEIYSPSGKEGEVAEYLKSVLTQNGFEIFEDRQKNILAHRGDAGKCVMFCAHMDTVEPSKDIKFDIHKETVRSNGRTILGADNKAAIAAILEAMEDIDPDKSIEILFTVKEEIGGGLIDFPFSGIESETCFVFDSVSPIGTIITNSPDIINFEIKIQGKAAHLSEIENGINAMIPATYLVQAIDRIPLSENTIVNVGKFTSGENTNSVPAFTSISGEIRSFDHEEFNEVMNAFHELNDKVVSKFGVESKLEFLKNTRSYGYAHEKSFLTETKIFDIYKKLEIEPELKKSWAVSDANILNCEGIYAINLGDGVVDAHTTNEHISLESIMSMYKIILEIAKKYGS